MLNPVPEGYRILLHKHVFNQEVIISRSVQNTRLAEQSAPVMHNNERDVTSYITHET